LRKEKLDDLFGYLLDLLSEFHAGLTCSYRCDAIQSGVLAVELARIGVLIKPSPPFNGFSFEEISRKLRAIKLPRHCGDKMVSARNGGRILKSCRGYESTIHTVLALIEKDIVPIPLR
jgi:hypothetical protein